MSSLLGSRMGTVAMKGMRLVTYAKDEMRTGARKLTLVKPASPQTRSQMREVVVTNTIRHPIRSKKRPVAGVRTMGMTVCRAAL